MMPCREEALDVMIRIESELTKKEVEDVGRGGDNRNPVQ